MPEMDGYELARAIRSIEATAGTKRVPIVACTANALRGEAELCLAAGMDAYLAKPVELRSLASVLDERLPLRRPAVAIDNRVLAMISGGNAEMERELLAEFQRTNGTDAALLGVAVASRDVPALVAMSHRMKGASRTMGASALGAVCERLENAGRIEDWAAIEATMAEFQTEMQRLDAHYANEGDPTPAALHAG
jgi:CheY-like chemotaxis protein